MKKIFVTGADGFLGSNVVRILLERGFEVTAFLFPNSPSKTLDGLSVEKVYGDLLNAEDLKIGMKGCDAAIHIAANTSIWPARSKFICDVNVKGTKNVIAAVLDNRLQRLTYVGTANSFGFGDENDLGNETKPFVAGKYGLDYIDSKYHAQLEVLDAVKTKNLNAVVVNPTFMFGPHDSKPSAGAMILAVQSGKVPGYSKGGRNFVHVKDAATAICNSLQQGKVGDCYILGNENLTYKQIFSLIAEVVGVKAPSIYFPKPITLLYGKISELIFKINKKEPTVSYAAAQISNDKHFFSAEKARRELGLPQTPIKQAIQEAFDWFKENKYI